MAALTFRLANSVVNNFGELVEGTDQAAATLTTGWVVAKNASPLSSEMDNGVEQASTTFSSNAVTAKPSALITGTTANAFRSTNPYTGEFANTNWTITLVWRSVTTAHSGTVRVRIRVFKSVNADGSGATELTGSTQVGTTSAAGSTTVDTISTVTWAPGGVLTFTNEYLFIAVAMEVVTASGSNTADADLRTGSGITTGTRVLTSVFTAVDAATVRLSLTPSGSDALGAVDSATAKINFTPSGVHEYIDTIYKEENLLGGNTAAIPNSASRQAQSIAPPIAGEFNSVDLWIGAVNSPLDNLIVEIRDDSAGSPGSTILSSATITASSIGTTLPGRVRIYLDKVVAVTGSNVLWIVMRRSGADDLSNYIQFGEDLVDSNYTRGTAKNSGNAGANWDISSLDLQFSVSIVVPAGLARLTLTPSSSEVYTPGASGTVFTDSATATLVFTPSGLEERTVFDAATGLLALVPSSADILAAVDSSTIPLALTPGATVEQRVSTDAATTLLLFTPSGTEAREEADSGTETLLLVPSGNDIAVYADASTKTLTLTPSATEIQQDVDTGTAALGLSPSGTDTEQAVDSVSTRLALTPSGNEQQSGATSDATTITVALTASGADSFTGADSASGSLRLTPSAGQEGVEHTDTNTGSITLTPSSIDTAQYVDGGTARINSTPTGTDAYESADNAVATLRYTPSSNEQYTTVDQATALLGLVPSTQEIATYTDSDVGLVTFVPGGTETKAFGDTDELYLHLTVLTAPTIQYVFTARAYLRWMSSVVKGRWSTKASYNRWDDTIMLSRWVSRAYERFL